MLFINNIPHLRIYRNKVYLPVDPKSPNLHGLVAVLSKTTQDTIDVIKNMGISGNGKYNNLYMDYAFRGSILNKPYYLNLSKERHAAYDDIEKQCRTITANNLISNMAGKNFYFDLSDYNKIFFEKTKSVTNYKLKSKTYLDFIIGTINDNRFSVYKNKVIILDIAKWVTNGKMSSSSRVDNPLMYIYYQMLKNLDEFKSIGNIDIILYHDRSLMRINPSQCDKYSIQRFKSNIRILGKGIVPEEDSVEKEFEKTEVYQTVAKGFSDKYNFTGDEDDTTDSDEIEEKVRDRAEELDEKESKETPEEEPVVGTKLKKKLADKLEDDKKLAQDIYTMTQEKKTGKSAISNKRDQELREKQKEIKLSNMTIEDLRNINPAETKIDKIDVTDKVKTSNTNITTIKYPNFEKTYNRVLSKKDLANTFLILNEASIPTYVRKLDVKDTSDELNYKETYSVDLEDSNRVRHHLSFDMPKFIDGKFMYLHGNKKMINKQLFMKPIVKTGPNEVQICSNYNKIFMRRNGTKVSAKIEKFKKAVAANPTELHAKFGDNLATNNNYKTTIEYDDLSKVLSYLRIGAKIEIYFNQDEVNKLLKQRKITVDSANGWMCIGFLEKKHAILVNTDTQMMGNSMDIIDYILSVSSKKLVDDFRDASSGKKFIYTRATIMKKQVPVVLLLGYLEGLTTVLRKAKIVHHFTDARPKVGLDEGVVRFADGYLVYERLPFENSLLMNAFADIPTQSFNYDDFDNKDAYLSIFDVMFNQRNIANAFDNFYDFMIDPITKEVLDDMNYPTGFVEVVLFANSLLNDNSYVNENDMSIYRIRSNEIVNALLYKRIADAYGNYRRTAENNNPVKISIPKDVVIKDLLMAQTVEDYSTLNPRLTMGRYEAIHTVKLLKLRELP